MTGIAKAFRLFNEKAEKLARLSFMEKIKHPNAGVTISFARSVAGGVTVTQEQRGPAVKYLETYSYAAGLFYRHIINVKLRTATKIRSARAETQAYGLALKGRKIIRASQNV